MTKEGINLIKEKLENELKLLKKELETVGRVNPENPKDWEPVPQEIDVVSADPGDIAESIEGFEENSAILKQLEIRYNNIKEALSKIETGTYGICEICSKPIEDDRLEANPAAETCQNCMNK